MWLFVVIVVPLLWGELYMGYKKRASAQVLGIACLVLGIYLRAKILNWFISLSECLWSIYPWFVFVVIFLLTITAV